MKVIVATNHFLKEQKPLIVLSFVIVLLPHKFSSILLGKKVILFCYSVEEPTPVFSKHALDLGIDTDCTPLE